MFSAIQSRDERLLAAALASAKKEALEQTDPKTGLSPLSSAVACENVEALQALLEAGANVSGQTSSGQQSALHLAAAKGLSDCIHVLIAAGANVNAQDTLLMTPLHCAAQNGHASAVTTLLAHGADVKAVAKHGWTALHRAASKGHTDIVQLLCEHGADVMAMLDSSTSKKLASCTPKMLAEQAHHIDTVAFLSAQMRKVNGSGSISGVAPSIVAAATTGAVSESTSANSSLFGKIAALKANASSAIPKSELRRLAADGHARAKSVAIQKEDIPKKEEGVLNVDKDVTLASLTPIVPRPQLQKRGHKQNLLAETAPDLTSISSVTSEIIKPTPIAWTATPAAMAAEPSPSPSLSESSGGRSASPLAQPASSSVTTPEMREDLEDMQKSLSELQMQLTAQHSRIRLLEWISIVLGLLVILSLILR